MNLRAKDPILLFIQQRWIDDVKCFFVKMGCTSALLDVLIKLLVKSDDDKNKCSQSFDRNDS